MHVLVVEDDARISAWIVGGLREAGHRVESVADGREALGLALEAVHDVLVVDRMLPRLDGLALVRALRAAGVRTPVLFLSALSAVEERVAGLEAGADDYLGKPFAFSELVARVAALGRRPVAVVETSVLRVADLELDLLRRETRRAGTPVALMPREFAMLEVLMRNDGRVVTRAMLLEQVWGFDFDPRSSLIETYVSRLRDKIDRPFPVTLLHTVRGAGYSLRAPRG